MKTYFLDLDSTWYLEYISKEKTEVEKLFNTLTVMICEYLDDKTYEFKCIVRLDFYKLENILDKKTWKNIKSQLINRYVLIDLKEFFLNTIHQIGNWGLDISSYLIRNNLING